MKMFYLKVVISLALLSQSSVSSAQTDSEWMIIDEPAEIRNLINGRAMDGKYWIFYFRADGKMAYWQDGSDFISVREWSINEKGELCMFVYSMPDRLIDCQILKKSAGSPVEYLITAKIGTFKIRFTDPSKELTDAVAARAGSD